MEQMGPIEIAVPCYWKIIEQSSCTISQKPPVKKAKKPKKSPKRTKKRKPKKIVANDLRWFKMA